MKFKVAFIMIATGMLHLAVEAQQVGPSPATRKRLLTRPDAQNALCAGKSGLKLPNCDKGYVCVWPPTMRPCRSSARCPGECKKLCGPKAKASVCPNPKYSKCVRVPKDVCNPFIRTDCPTYCEGPKPCATLAGLQCPKGQICVEDPSDDCPSIAADCPGMCVDEKEYVAVEAPENIGVV